MDTHGIKGLEYLHGRRVGDVMQALQEGTIDTLRHHGRPVRVLRLPELNARSMGGLLMHFMLETVVTAALIGVDAFDQPAVEDGKQRARAYLQEMQCG